MCGLLRYSLYGTRDAAQNWEEELASTLSSLKLTRGSACPCVISKKYEIKKQVIGEDPDHEKSGEKIESRHQMESQRYHNRGRSETRQGDTERFLSWSKRIALQHRVGVERMDEGKGQSRCRQEQTQAEHEWDNANDGDDRDRQRMVDDE